MVTAAILDFRTNGRPNYPAADWRKLIKFCSFVANHYGN